MLLIKLMHDICADKPYIIKPTNKDNILTTNPINYIYNCYRQEYILVKANQHITNLDFFGKGSNLKESLDTLKNEIKRILDLGFLVDTDLMLTIIPYKDLSFEKLPFITDKGATSILLARTNFSWFYSK